MLIRYEFVNGIGIVAFVGIDPTFVYKLKVISRYARKRFDDLVSLLLTLNKFHT